MKNNKHILFAWSIYTNELSYDEAVADINRALSYASVAGAGLLDRAGDVAEDVFVEYLHKQLGYIYDRACRKKQDGATARKGLDKFYTANIVQSDSGGYRTIAFLTPKSDVDFLIAYGVTCAPLSEVGQLPPKTFRQVETRLYEAEQSDRRGVEPFDRLYESCRARGYIERLADDGGTNEGGGEAGGAGICKQEKRSKVEPTSEDLKILQNIEDQLKRSNGMFDPIFFCKPDFQRSTALRGFSKSVSILINGEQVSFIVGFTVKRLYFARKADGKSPHYQWIR